MALTRTRNALSSQSFQRSSLWPPRAPPASMSREEELLTELDVCEALLLLHSHTIPSAHFPGSPQVLENPKKGTNGVDHPQVARVQPPLKRKRTPQDAGDLNKTGRSQVHPQDKAEAEFDAVEYPKPRLVIRIKRSPNPNFNLDHMESPQELCKLPHKKRALKKGRTRPKSEKQSRIAVPRDEGCHSQFEDVSANRKAGLLIRLKRMGDNSWIHIAGGDGKLLVS